MPLTETRPKPMLKAANKTILEHNLEAVKSFVDEIILVVGYKKEMIIDAFGDEYKGINLSYIEQKEQKGTGHALLQAKDMLLKDISEKNRKVIVLNGDCIYSGKDIERCIVYNYAILGAEVKNPENYGVLEHENYDEKEGVSVLKNINEKPKKAISNLINAGLYVLDEGIFDILSGITPSLRGEIELTDAIVKLAKTEDVKCVTSIDYWLTLTFPWDLLEANEFLLKKMETTINNKEIHKESKHNLGIVERYATLKDAVFIDKGTLVKNGAYIEGPVMIGKNCVIGPNCYIRPYTTIGDNCKIGNAVEVKNSIIGDKTHVGHLSYVGDSVLGNNVNFGAGTKVANLRHDNTNVFSMIKGKLVDSGRRKLGTICGENVHTGINTSIYPGRKLFANTITKPGEVVEKDKI